MRLSLLPLFIVVFCVVGASHSFAQSESEGLTLYNQNAQPLSIQQAVAGKNAPSYDYSRSAATQNYNPYGSGPSSGSYVPQGTLTPEQQRDLQEQYLEQQAFYQQMGQQQGIGTQQGGGTFEEQLAKLTGKSNAEDEKPKDRKVKRVVRNALNNPLATPPRLFNPDQ
jgi:hypothetical protein